MTPTPDERPEFGAQTPVSPDDKMRASPERLRSFAERLQSEGDAEMAEQVRRAAAEIDATRDGGDASH